MGIQSLTSLVSANDHLLHDFKLRNTSIVIDGSNILYRLYESCRIDSRYGGDYKLLEKNCKKFFDNLRRCNVEPIVFFDGTLEQTGIKLETNIKRQEGRLADAQLWSSGLQGRQFVLPLLASGVMINVLNTLNVKFYQCAGEADAFIASKANSIDCPVVSLDSDFYIFDLKSGYIPFDSIEWTEICKSDDGDFLSASIYHLENLLNCFKNLDRTVLPLFATLMGNDFIKSSLFTNLYNNIPTETTKRKSQTQGTKRHDKMIAILNWLQAKSVEQSVSEVLSFVKKEKREYLRKSIDLSLKMYEDYEKINRKTLDVDEECKKILSFTRLPEWFLNDYLIRRIPLSFISLLSCRRVILPTLVEDFNRPSVYFCSRTIRQAAYHILLKDVTTDYGPLPVHEYLRHGCSLVKQEVFYSSTAFDDLPSLNSIDTIPVDVRAKKFYDVIGLRTEDVEKLCKFPSFLTQFLCVTIYWVRNDDTKLERAYVDALITCTYVCLLQYCTDESWMKSAFVPSSDESQETNKFVHCVKKYDFAPKNDAKKSYKPDISILHAFNQWQVVAYSFRYLLAALNLSVLPIADFSIENCFSGRLCYNLTKVFSSTNDFESGLKKIYIADDVSSTIRCLQTFRSNIFELISKDLNENKSTKNRSKKSSSTKKLSKQNETTKRNSVEIDGELVELKSDDDVDVNLSNNMFAALRLL